MAIADAAAVALDPKLVALYEAAEAARERSYAPYSKFSVGAALLAADGSVISGGNVENASYGMTICAERAAICRAVAEGHREFQAVAVAGPAETVAPCGACRQVLAEFLDPEGLVVFPHETQLLAVELKVLLPHAFGPEDVLSGS